MILTPEQQALNASAQMLPEKPESLRGHKFRKGGNMLHSDTISETWYSCECGATFQTRVNLADAPQYRTTCCTEVLFDCPLATEEA